MKQDIFEAANVKPLEAEKLQAQPKYIKLQRLSERWEKRLDKISLKSSNDINVASIKYWTRQAGHAKKLLNNFLTTLNQIRQNEYNSAKNHFIRIGQYGPIARMTNPKPRSGPTASSYYPIKNGEPIRRAVNDRE